MTMSTVEAIRQAANLIRTKGHTKNQYQSFNGSVCAIGALRRVLRSDLGVYYVAVLTVSRELLPLGYVGLVAGETAIMMWNDAPERTAEEVITLFEFAALCEEQKELLAGVQPEVVNA